jgi:LAS superfamily LD-carboxypeptidase LdcB
VESGWRSPQRQKQLLDEAVVEYGSAEAAARWVAPPDRSPHVAGSAIDVGSPDASAWLARHGAAYGLCRIYGNEPWHFERRADAGVHGCPPVYADAADDPRMRP